MTTTTLQDERSQINVRIPTILKQKAQQKAEDMNLSLSFVVMHFLEKFAEEDVFQVHTDIDFDTIFDRWVVAYCDSDIWKKTRKRIGSKVKKVIKEIW